MARAMFAQTVACRHCQEILPKETENKLNINQVLKANGRPILRNRAQ
jgi:hypothetical protein